MSNQFIKMSHSRFHISPKMIMTHPWIITMYFSGHGSVSGSRFRFNNQSWFYYFDDCIMNHNEFQQDYTSNNPAVIIFISIIWFLWFIRIMTVKMIPLDLEIMLTLKVCDSQWFYDAQRPISVNHELDFGHQYFKITSSESYRIISYESYDKQWFYR